MKSLTPSQAGELADTVYDLRDDTVTGLHRSGFLLGCEEDFAVGNSSQFRGTSGTRLLFKKVSGFGYITAGKGSRQGEVLIVIRGTALTSIHDWISNANIALQRGPTGHLVLRWVWLLLLLVVLLLLLLLLLL